MTFTLLPAVDVAAGRAAQAIQECADPDGPASDPRRVALDFQAAGASWLHLVDLDAAYGRGSNADLLAELVGELDVDVELSGGIGDDASLARALATGCARVNVGTGALADPAWCARVIAEHGDRVALCLDVRITHGPDGSVAHRLAARGGTTDGGDLWAAIDQLDAAGCARYVVTDVGRDGRLAGPDLDLYRAVGRATGAAVIASGGIASLDDLVALAQEAAAGAALDGADLEGAIVGQALHAGRFTLAEALAAVCHLDRPRG